MSRSAPNPKPDLPLDRRSFQEVVDRLLAPGLAALPRLPEHFSSESALLCFQFAMARCLQQGPRFCNPDHPARLIHAAREAVQAGMAPPETPGTLHEELEDAASLLRENGFWDRNAPLWWEPLPTPTSLCQLWMRMTEWGRTIIARLRQQVAAGQERHAGDEGLWHVANAVPDPFLALFTGILEEHFRDGTLGLARVGVGADAEISNHRQDEVRYLNGTEWVEAFDLAQLSLLTRWARQWLGSKLPATLGVSCQPPQNAMLARYGAKSQGYRAHVDNPGGDLDNGRALTMILYLNPKRFKPEGGALRIWRDGEAVSNESVRQFEPGGGDLICFDARSFIHEVQPIGEGPARWALSLWFNDRSPQPLEPHPPKPTATELFSGILDPKMPPATVVCHHFENTPVSGQMRAYPCPESGEPRTAIVCTTYRGGPMLRAWCRYHLDLGFDHLILVFDRLNDHREARLARELEQRYPDRLTCMDGEALRTAGWPSARKFKDRDAIEEMAQSSGHSWSVAARQTLNASHVLTLAKTDFFGGAPLDWLLHLDDDEFFYLDGTHRGGTTIQAHFALASARAWPRIRYLNSELLPPLTRGKAPHFKINPKLAAARLGRRGWPALCRELAMNQGDERPYFSGYHNGKSAVAVAPGLAAAGVHGWYLSQDPSTDPILAGPTILHFHCANARDFVQKYLSKAKTPPPSDQGLFAPSPLEEAAMATLKAAANDPSGDLETRLTELFRKRTRFNADQFQLLRMAGLIHAPELPKFDASFPWFNS